MREEVWRDEVFEEGKDVVEGDVCGVFFRGMI